MATIYTYKDRNIRKTYTLFGVFFVVVIGIGWIFSEIYKSPDVLVIAVLFSIFMSFFSYWYSDKIVLRMANAHEIQKDQARDLYTIVENLSITAGLPTPRIYIIEDSSPNAFATGRDPKHSVVAVTRGLLSKLNKTELEGVLAHELSHIGNRDMLLSTMVVVLVGFISLISDMFLRSVFFGRFNDRDREGQAGGILFLIGLVLSIIAPIVGILMQLAISRKREFLADQSGALLTRYPEGLASALQKISDDGTPLRVAKSTTAHLWIESPYGKSQKRTPLLLKLFSTHPPVEDRIKALKDMAS